MLTSKFQKAERRIDERIQACVDEVNAQGEHLKKKLQELKTKTLEIVQKQKQDNQQQLQSKREVVEETQSQLEKASDLEYVVLHEKLFGKLKMLIEDDTTNAGSAYSAETGFKLEVSSWNVDLGLNLIPEQNMGVSDQDLPSTSSMSPHSGQGDACSRNPSTSRDDNQEPSSTNKRIKLEAEADVLCLSDEDEDEKPDFFDLTI
ncbi:uncharacterized protein [Amphiura filiformis]|uniref:uncharacterized protein n=1 Tax=Amphiura filiformis TaxID=82378 RepID=UPI003B220464